MAIPFSKFSENPLDLEKFNKNPKNPNFEKFKKNPKNHSNLKSLFWAFLVSIFAYISVFYIFSLSPSAVFCTTKFWFLISNTLILIIAADFASFSSDKKHDFYQLEYVKNTVRTKSTIVLSTDASQYMKTVEKTVTSDPKEIVIDDEKPHEKIIEVVVASPTYHENHSNQIVEYKPQILPTLEEKDDYGYKNPRQKFGKKKPEMFINNTIPEVAKRNRDEKKKKNKCVRGVSDKAMITAVVAASDQENEKNMVLQRTLSERHEKESTLVEENEFSSMSDEELNRRVEDFIRRFNRQIRLQAANDPV